MSNRLSSRCIACHSALPDSAPSPGAESFYVACGHCHTLHLRPLPAIEANQAFESAEAAHEMAQTDDARLPYLRQQLRRLTAPGNSSSRLLDVGCSAGRLMGLAQESGWRATGIDMSENLAAEARRHNPASTVHAGDILTMDVQHLGTFQQVTALDVIEHVLDPEAFLRRMYLLLDPGGELLLHTPNARGLQARLQGPAWGMRIPQYHFHLFSPMGLEALLNRTGFVECRLSTSSGSGLETGMGLLVARLKQQLLSMGNLGNALVVVARKPK